MTTGITAPLRPPTGRVHWVGAGMSTGSGLGRVCDGASTVLWGRTSDRAGSRLADLGLTGRAETRAFTPTALAAELVAGDVVVSMLPATEHPDLLGLAVEHDAHFVCSSYCSPGIAAQAERAAARGLVVLSEIGLDPGIDHLLGHALVRRARETVGDGPATIRLTSYCGSNPAVPNDFRYRFSWAPRGVLTALLTPARLIEGRVVTAVARPWEAVRQQTVSDETFEVYPNRDSVPFVETYQLPRAWDVETFVRGTLRLEGWSDAWKAVFDELPGASQQRLTNLAAELAAQYPTTSADHDRVVMSVRLQVDPPTGVGWTGEYVLDEVGGTDEAATPRLVSLPLAGGILEVTAGHVPPGLHQAAADLESVDRQLGQLAVWGVTASYRGD